MGGKAGAGHDVELIEGHPAHGEVTLNAALVVEHLGVDQRADGPIDVVCTDPLQGCHRARTFQRELGERGLVEQRRGFTAGPVFSTDGREPVGPLVGVYILRNLAGGQVGEPIRPLPTKLVAEAGPGRQ